MARDWKIESKYVEYCSCDLGCPCGSVRQPIIDVRASDHQAVGTMCQICSTFIETIKGPLFAPITFGCSGYKQKYGRP